jgi:hypothetical protein
VSYKSIDLQTSLPRAAELTPLLQHQQNRPAAEQAMLAQQNLKTAEQQAHKPAKTESASQGKISDQQRRGGGRQPSGQSKQSGGKEREPEHAAEHPYKGKHIDFMG